MIGNKIISISLTLNIVAIIIGIVMAISISLKHFKNKRTLMITTAVLIIIVGNIMEIYATQHSIANHKFEIVSAVDIASAYMIFVASYALMIVSLFVKYIDNIIEIKTEKKRAAKNIALITLPIAINILIHMIYPNVFVLGFGMIVSSLVSYYIYQHELEESIRGQAKEIQTAKNKIMMKQIHPHFIFNSLMAIEEMCYKDSELAAKSIENFAGYLRTNLDVLTNDGAIEFSKELKNIKQYIELEKAASSSEFDVIYNLEIKDFNIAPLSIQPLVENAVRHGINTLKEKGKIEISTRRKGDFVIVCVKDNGTHVGDRIEYGVGLNNVRERIEDNMNGSLKIEFKDDGTYAIVAIPME